MNNPALEQKTVVGGWSPYRDLTPEDLKIFNEALDGFVGVQYTPVSVSTQVVNGTNYRFKCTAAIPPSEVEWEAIIEIYQPLDGKPHITSITRL